MICFYCKGETVENKTVYVEEVGKSLIIIRNVPCEKCVTCGEEFFSAPVAKRIEEIVKSFEKVISEISVVDYSAA